MEEINTKKLLPQKTWKGVLNTVLSIFILDCFLATIQYLINETTEMLGQDGLTANTLAADEMTERKKKVYLPRNRKYGLARTVCILHLWRASLQTIH